MKPFVKWAGGKRQILSKIKEYIDDAISDDKNRSFTYIEPFLGGGAVFFDLAPKKAIINDLNSDLINAYEVIKSDQYLKLIDLLKDYKNKYLEDKHDTYYDMREKDRLSDWASTDKVVKAARMIFLNKTCYNGLYRVNSKGQFNTPIGRYHNPLICDENNIIEIHDYLSSNNIKILNSSYEVAMKKAKDGDIIYVDPPYDYQDDDGFTKYQMEGFTFEDFKKLKYECDCAIDKGAIVIISNNATDKVITLFEEDPKYKIGYYSEQINSLRCINSKGSDRKTGREIIVLGMKDEIPFPQANDLDKIVKILMLNEEELSDRQKLLQTLEVKSERQISYYLAALKFLGYITNRKTFTEKIKLVGKDIDSIEKKIIDDLLTNETFKVFSNTHNYYKQNKFIDINLIIEELKDNKLSDSTIKRRASTVKSWIEWIISKKTN